MHKQILRKREHTFPIRHRVWLLATGRVLLLHDTRLMIKFGRRKKTKKTRLYIVYEGIAQANSNIEYSRRTVRRKNY